MKSKALVRGLMPAIAAVLLVAAAFPMTSLAATAAGITFDVDMYSSCIGGAASPNSTLSFVWRDSAGNLKVKGAVPVSPSGFWSYCSDDPTVWVTHRDAIKVDDGVTLRKYVVANLTMDPNRATGVISGTGPAGRTLRLCSRWGYFNDFETCHSVRIRQDGTWTFDSEMGGLFRVDIDVHWKSPNGDRISVYVAAPFVDVTIGKSAVTGWAAPRAGILLHNGLRASAWITTGESGRFERNDAQFLGSDGSPRRVRVGDHIFSTSFAPDEDWIVPLIEASADVDTDVVAGTCHHTGTTNDLVRVVVRRYGTERGIAYDGAAADGTFSISLRELDFFGDPANIRHGDKVIVQCFQPNGDSASWGFLVP
jgi:hypothetical protein